MVRLPVTSEIFFWIAVSRFPPDKFGKNQRPYCSKLDFWNYLDATLSVETKTLALFKEVQSANLEYTHKRVYPVVAFQLSWLQMIRIMADANFLFVRGFSVQRRHVTDRKGAEWRSGASFYWGRTVHRLPMEDSLLQSCCNNQKINNITCTALIN